MECVAKVVSMLHPWQVLAIQLDSCRILDIIGPATEVHTLGLGELRYGVSGENQVVLLAIPLTDGQHPLEHLPVRGQQYQVISIATGTIPQASNVAAKLE